MGSRTVFIVVHDDGLGEGIEVRGVYETIAAAKWGRTTRTPKGRPSTSQWAHSDLCCDIIDREVEPSDTVKEQEK